LALLAVLAQQLLPPSLHDEHVVNGDDVNLLDTLGLVLVVLLDVARDLVGTSWGEAGSGQLSSRALRLRCKGRTYAPGTRTKTFLPVNLDRLIFSSMSLILISTSGTASPTLSGAAEAREAKALWAV
jgi:hypothetical protein